MPYQNEYSKHKAVADILNNQKLKNYFENMQLYKLSFDDFISIDEFCYFKNKINKNHTIQLKDLETYLQKESLDFDYVFAFDGSRSILSLNDYMNHQKKKDKNKNQFLYPGSEIGLIKISQSFIDLKKVEEFEKNSFPLVSEYKDIYINSSFDCLVPGFNISNQDYPHPKDFLRKSVYSYLKYTHNPFVDFLEQKFVQNKKSEDVCINRITLLDTFRDLIKNSDGFVKIKNICDCEKTFILKDFFMKNYSHSYLKNNSHDDSNHHSNIMEKQIEDLKNLLKKKPENLDYFSDVSSDEHYHLLAYQKKLSQLKENIRQLFSEYKLITEGNGLEISQEILDCVNQIDNLYDEKIIEEITVMEKNISAHLEQFDIQIRKKRNKINLSSSKTIEKENYSDYLGHKIIGMKKCVCEKEVFISDVLNFHESFQSLQGGEGFYNEIMLFIEKLALLNLLETIESNILDESLRKQFFDKTIFLMDGPLAIYQQGKWLTDAFKARVEYFVKKYQINIIGVEKSGHFYDHLQMLEDIKLSQKKEKLNKGFIYFLDDKYIKKYIRNMSDSSLYGDTTYFGKKAFYKNMHDELYVINLNYLDLSEEKKMVNQRNSQQYIDKHTQLAKTLYIFERYHSKRFKNGLSLTSLAHENASLSNRKISKKLLETYFNFLLS